MEKRLESSHKLAARITWEASKQTYYTIRFLVDRERTADAFRAYAYFRWVDDRLDGGTLPRSKRVAFILSQRELMERCYLGDPPGEVGVEESMLVDLIRGDREKYGGLQSYIHNMMAIMAFDADRRGRLIQQGELVNYTRWLATAVTDALHYFIGHDCPAPPCETRYLAAAAAHITHMLRDTLEDIKAGFFNVPREYLEAHRISPQDVTSEPYRMWVRSRVRLAQEYFKAGKHYLTQVSNFRCRLAGYSYIARFEGLLDVIARDGYRLQPDYAEYKNMGSGIKMGWSSISLALENQRNGRMLPAPDESF